MPRLTNEERIRYGRHLLLPELSVEGQERLKAASVLIVGAGGLGAPVALYLAAAGVGRLGILDDDDVSVSNLQRQILYGTADVGSPKAVRATMRLRDLNPLVRVEPMQVRLSASNAVEVVSEYDLVVDATDNFQTRYLLADVSAITGRPVVYGAVYRFEGQVAVFGMPGGPCYRCLFPEPPPPYLAPTCGETGVLGAATGVIGSLQAVETIKVLTGLVPSGTSTLKLIDLLAGQFESVDIPRDPGCPACGLAGGAAGLIDYDAFCGVRSLDGVPAISALELVHALESDNPPLLVDVRRIHESRLATIGGLQIPESELPTRLAELGGDVDRQVVTYCRAGLRSARAARFLMEAGYEHVAHLEGGLSAWAADVDPTLAVY